MTVPKSLERFAIKYLRKLFEKRSNFLKQLLKNRLGKIKTLSVILTPKKVSSGKVENLISFQTPSIS